MRSERSILVRAWFQALADETHAFRVQSVAAETRAARSPTSDYVVTLVPAHGRKQIRLLVEMRARLNPREALAACAHRIQTPKKKQTVAGVLIACPYISPRVAELCREHNVGYLDQAGNCDIRANGLVVHVGGRPNVAPDTRSISNPFATKASRVARLLLGQPNRSWQVQELAGEGRISLGLAFKAKDALIEEGYAEERDGRVALRDARALLNALAAAYKSPAHRTRLYVMEDTSRTEQAAAEWCERQRVEYALAEFSGAWRLAPMVRYNQACICVRESALRDTLADLIEALNAKQVDTGSNLLAMVTSDESVFFGAREVEGLRVLSPIQLYLDLYTKRGRGTEAADELLRRVLEPSFNRAGQESDQTDTRR